MKALPLEFSKNSARRNTQEKNARQSSLTEILQMKFKYKLGTLLTYASKFCPTSNLPFVITEYISLYNCWRVFYFIPIVNSIPIYWVLIVNCLWHMATYIKYEVFIFLILHIYEAYNLALKGKSLGFTLKSRLVILEK